MKVIKEIEFNEQDVKYALLCAAERHLEGIDSDSITIKYVMGVRGDYDKGNAEEFILKAILEVNE